MTSTKPADGLLSAAVLAMGLFWVAAGVAGEPVDLLTNGGFEEGTTGWNADPKHTLLSDRAEAHSGTACLSGEATAPKQALFLRRRVKVKAGNLYQFEIWAKATNRTKAVLFVVPPGEKARKMVATWDKVPRRWTRYSVPVTVVADGTLQLEVVGPSSHGAPAGRLWIDDLALYETEMPPVESISEDVGFNDEPAMAAADDGALYVAWNSFRDGADSLQVARMRPQGTTFQSLGRWQVLGGEGTYVMGIRAVSAGEHVVVLYAAEQKGNWDVYAVHCGPDGPSEPVAVTSHGGVDVKPDGAWSDGVLWVSWESNRNGWRQIYAASLRDGVVSEPTALSAEEVSSYDPSVAMPESGGVCVAWHAFAENNYDVYLRRRGADDSWERQRRLTRAASVDRHAELFTRGDELWLVYENALTEAYNIGRTNRRRLLVAKIASQGLLAPAGGAIAFEGRSEAGQAAFDASGRLWLSFLKPRPPRAGWDAALTCLAGDRWMQPVPLSTRKGMDRAPCLALVDNRVVVAMQSDDAPRSWSDLDQMLEATSNIYLASIERDSVDRDTAERAAGIALEPLAEPAEPFEAAGLRIARGEDIPTPSIRYQGRTLKLFFGDLHEHTEVSVCNRLGDQSIDESYQHMRDLGSHDFACATDHGYNINPYLWGYLAKQARANDDPDRFLTFLAEEWTSTFEEYSAEHPYGFYGHRNLIFADPYFPRWFNARNRQTPAEVWEALRKMNANFIHIPHQLADTGNVPTDWNFTDEEAQPVAEIFQTRGSYEYKSTPREAGRSTPGPGSFLQDAWARGIVIGVIASPDHGGGYGKACVFAPELSREAVLDAIRARHCYGTTAAKIFLDVRVNGHLMGEKVAAATDGPVKVEILVRCPGEIERIEVCRNNRFIYTSSPAGREAELTFVDREPLAGRSYYYVRVLQEDEEIAWSSPVWFGAE